MNTYTYGSYDSKGYKVITRTVTDGWKIHDSNPTYYKNKEEYNERYKRTN